MVTHNELISSKVKKHKRNKCLSVLYYSGLLGQKPDTIRKKINNALPWTGDDRIVLFKNGIITKSML